MLRKILPFLERYEKHLSALAMVAGFVADNLVFTRVDLFQTQALLAGYAGACFVSIPLLHYIETRATRVGRMPRWRVALPIVTQFALGGFWSAFVIFYGRAAVFGASWPFLIFVFLVFLGSEYFHRYHERLVFTSVLFFFALYAWAIFEVPIYTGTIGTLTYLESGAVAVAVFALFTIVLRMVAHERFKKDVRRVRVGASIVFLAMNLFYFTGVLPPLPLSSQAAGIYHSVQHVPGAYLGTSEAQDWKERYLGFSPTFHVVPGELLYAYGSIFAPTDLTTTIVHRWEQYDSHKNSWTTKALVSYPIVGGREQGYRGYSNMRITEAGSWRVTIETSDGRVMERLPFTVIYTNTSPALETEALP